MIKRLLGGEYRRAAAIGLGVLVLLMLLFGSELVRVYADWLWFTDVGYRSVFARTALTKTGLVLAVSLLVFAILYSNLWVARRLNPQPHLYLDERHEQRVNLTSIGQQSLSAFLLVGSLAIAVLVGLGAARGWYDYTLFRNPVPFPDVDPIFHRNAGFYVFTFPFLNSLYRWLMMAVGFSLVGVAALYWVERALDFVAGQPRMAAHVRMHLSALLGAFLLVKAWGYWLARYQVLFAGHSRFSGAGYTDVHVRLVVLSFLVGLSIIAALALFINMRARNARLPLYAIATWVVVSFLGGTILPSVVQQVRVTPNELQAEQPYIAHNIKATRAAFGLEAIRPLDFPAAQSLNIEKLRTKRETLSNVRLWDYGPLGAAYQQLQAIRAYYTFAGVDVDRYRFPEGVRQVALSVREMNVNRLEERTIGSQGVGWVNRHLIYTHGYGLVMSPVDRVAGGGLPELIIKDFPPQTPPGLALSQPQIYFGEMTGDYVIVNTAEQEFDYPSGAQPVATEYKGAGGVPLKGFLRRALFAARFGDLNILWSGQFTNKSRVLFAREIGERARRIAPFLRLDEDPYPVIHNGRVVWIIDAYTTSPWYPYSRRITDPEQPFASGPNYMRNAVKIAIDAYEGTVRYYVSDKNDPVTQSLGIAFPGLFLPLEKMPAALREHLRYPKDLFRLQAEVYRQYHMTSPRLFYSREDRWDIPVIQREDASTGAAAMQAQAMKPYYMYMNLPGVEGSERGEYVLMLPFTPTGGKQNMIAWMAGRCDPEHLGQLVVYDFPKQKVVYGPAQIDALIDQQPPIAEKLTLWKQQGSRVIRAPVMVLPIEDSLLYVEPLYLRAENSQIPELKQVIVAYGNQVEMADTLDAALERIFGGSAGLNSRPPTPTPAATAGPAGRPASPAAGPAASDEVRRLIGEANTQYNRAQEALRRGDWNGYGSEMRRLQQTLQRLKQTSGQ